MMHVRSFRLGTCQVKHQSELHACGCVISRGTSGHIRLGIPVSEGKEIIYEPLTLHPQCGSWLHAVQSNMRCKQHARSHHQCLTMWFHDARNLSDNTATAWCCVWVVINHNMDTAPEYNWSCNSCQNDNTTVHWTQWTHLLTSLPWWRNKQCQSVTSVQGALFSEQALEFATVHRLPWKSGRSCSSSAKWVSDFIQCLGFMKFTNTQPVNYISDCCAYVVLLSAAKGKLQGLPGPLVMWPAGSANVYSTFVKRFHSLPFNYFIHNLQLHSNYSAQGSMRPPDLLLSWSVSPSPGRWANAPDLYHASLSRLPSHYLLNRLGQKNSPFSAMTVSMNYSHCNITKHSLWYHSMCVMLLIQFFMYIIIMYQQMNTAGAVNTLNINYILNRPQLGEITRSIRVTQTGQGGYRFCQARLSQLH